MIGPPGPSDTLRDRTLDSRPGYVQLISGLDILATLAEFDPRIAGTPPLNLDLPTSDIDILCYAPDPWRFTSAVWRLFGRLPKFTMRQWTGSDQPVVATFETLGWHLEIFGQARPVAEQAGWRHFVIERRLLALGGSSLASAVMAHRRSGLKTEPAFAAVLKLSGDPYQAMLDLCEWTDDALSTLLRRAVG